MKNGRRPTKAQRNLMRYAGYDSNNWLIRKDTSTEMVIMHRFTEQMRTIPKRRTYDE